MNNNLIKIGYIFALVCFMVSLIFRTVSGNDLVELFLFLGGMSLLITTLYKVIVNKKK